MTPAPTTRPASRLRLAAFWIIYGLICSLGVLVILEIGVRIFAPQNIESNNYPQLWKADPVFGWVHFPRSHVLTNTGERNNELCTNDRGDIISCTPSEPRSCTQRVLIIGDSFVEALAVPYEMTFSARVQKDTGACIEVVGVGGWGPIQYLAVIRQRLRQEQVHYDLVIVNFFEGNDFLNFDPETIPTAEDIAHYRPFRLLPRGLSATALFDWFYPINQWLETWSHSYIAGRFAIRRLLDPADLGYYGIVNTVLPSQLNESYLAPTTRAFQLMADETRRTKTPLLVVLNPFFYQVLDPKGLKLRKFFPEIAGEVDMDLPTKAFLPRLRQIPDLQVVDLLPGLRERADRSFWGMKDQHFSPKGNEAWFDLCRSDIRKALGLDP